MTQTFFAMAKLMLHKIVKACDMKINQSGRCLPVIGAGMTVCCLMRLTAYRLYLLKPPRGEVKMSGMTEQIFLITPECH